MGFWTGSFEGQSVLCKVTLVGGGAFAGETVSGIADGMKGVLS